MFCREIRGDKIRAYVYEVDIIIYNIYIYYIYIIYIHCVHDKVEH